MTKRQELFKEVLEAITNTPEFEKISYSKQKQIAPIVYTYKNYIVVSTCSKFQERMHIGCTIKKEHMINKINSFMQIHYGD